MDAHPSTLRQWLGAERRNWYDIVEVFEQAAQQLQSAHDRGIVHGGIDPDTIAIDESGRVRLEGFGAAAPASDTAAPLVSQRAAYLAPEQAEGKAPDARSDQYALCVAFWWAIWDELPFEGDTLDAYASARRAGRPRKTSGSRIVAVWLPPALRRGLSSDPRQRFASMNAFLAAIGTGRFRKRIKIALLAGAIGLVLSLVVMTIRNALG